MTSWKNFCQKMENLESFSRRRKEQHKKFSRDMFFRSYDTFSEEYFSSSGESSDRAFGKKRLENSFLKTINLPKVTKQRKIVPTTQTINWLSLAEVNKSLQVLKKTDSSYTIKSKKQLFTRVSSTKFHQQHVKTSLQFIYGVMLLLSIFFFKMEGITVDL